MIMYTLNPQHIPLSLYIHVPWCIRKCPYCDFNSHALPEKTLSAELEQQYLMALIEDFKQQQPFIQQRPLQSIFIGGGTPSLISAQGYHQLLNELKQYIEFQSNSIHSSMEITLEANPATIEHAPFIDYLNAGINRLSLGVQSFNADHLQGLGRIHTPEHALNAISSAAQAGFQRINVDLMHGLPQQTVQQALDDLSYAVQAGATHISWYQLTIEPNTVFFRTQPILPCDEVLAEIQQQGEQYLISQGFIQYEVSAWRKEQPAQHNLNYWQFGDYLAIGAGAHGKVTLPEGIYRYQKTRLPKDYLAKVPAEQLQFQRIDEHELDFEFMMNALRLLDGVPLNYYMERTGKSIEHLQPILVELQQKKLLSVSEHQIQCSPLGQQYLNNVLQYFLTE